MKELAVKSDGFRKFNLLEADNVIGSLYYTKWFSFNAEIALASGAVYQVAQKGSWGTTIELKKDEQVLLSFKMGWNGSIIIESELGGVNRDFVLKPKGLFRNTYVLIDTEETELMALKPNYRWNNLGFDYRIESSEIFESPELHHVLCLVAIHCVNYYMSMATAAVI